MVELKMAPRVPDDVIPSPLTRSKLLVAFKGTRPRNLNIQDVNAFGERYLQKETSIRRFSASFKKLRLDHRRVKNSRNPELLNTWENEIYTWPDKTDPAEIEILTVDDEGVEQSETGVTMSGRATGMKLYRYED